MFDENPFYKYWNNTENNQFLLKYILNEDLEDYKLIQDRINFIENYDFNEIISKYESNENYIILIVFQDTDNFKTFSKFNVNSVKSNFKEDFKKFRFDNMEKIEQLIISLKTRYDDEWKINLINSSIKLNIELEMTK